MAWLLGRREREIRRLNRDAPVIIEAARQTTCRERLREVVILLREDLERAHDAARGQGGDHGQSIAQLRARHRDARRRRDDVALTAHTLAIIYLRAGEIGEPCRAAREAIESFLQQPA